MGIQSKIEVPPELDHFAMRNGVRCAGVHLIVDLHDAIGLNDIDHIEHTLRQCVDASNATLLHIHLHHFQPSGVSGVAVLAESHISIHTWPEAGYAALDVFMCGQANPDACIPILKERFGAGRVEVNEILRGIKPAPPPKENWNGAISYTRENGFAYPAT